MRKKFIFIESTAPNKNGHVAHLMKWNGEYYAEISLATGKYIRGLYFDNELQIENYGYRIVNVQNERPTMVGRNTNYGYMVWDLLREEF